MLVSSIVSQQLSNKAASTILARMRALVGHNERLLAARLCKADPSLLKTCGLSAAKLQAITAVASAVASGTLDLDQFDGRSDEEVSVTLREHRGVGPWTVQMFLIFGLHRTDVFAMGDVGLRRGLMLLHGLDAKPTDDMIAELTDHWRPYRTVASWYLWRLLD